MKKSQTYILIGCTLFSLALIFTAYALSPIGKEVKRMSFERNFSKQLQKIGTLDLHYNSFYIAGISKNRFYLANYSSPFSLLTSDFSCKDTAINFIKPLIDSLIDPLKFRCVVDSPYIYHANGSMPEILRSQLGKWRAQHYLDTLNYFADVRPLSNESVIYKAYSPQTESYELAIKRNGESFQYNIDLLQKQIDGLFCVDGQIHVNKSRNEVVYVSYYKNEFIVADTNLALKFRSHTIDTFSRALVKVARIEKEKSSILAQPPTRLNKISCTSQNLLFINSPLLSQNEDIDSFKKSSIIDVYNLTTGKYLSSLRIPRHMQQPVNDFRIINNYLIALYDHIIITYSIPTN